MQNKKVKYINLGQIEYQEAWDLQEAYFNKIVEIKINNRKENTETETPNFIYSLS